MYIACLEGFKPPTYCLAHHFVFRRQHIGSTNIIVRGPDFAITVERIRYAIFQLVTNPTSLFRCFPSSLYTFPIFLISANKHPVS